MNRDTKGRFIKANNDSMKLAIGDKITSSSQFRDGMIVSLKAKVHNGIRYRGISIKNAIMIKDKNDNWYACHDNPKAIGNYPLFDDIFEDTAYTDKDKKVKMFNKAYSWQICFRDDIDSWQIYDDLEDSKDIIFHGFHDIKIGTNLPNQYESPKYKKGDIVLIKSSLIDDTLCCCEVVSWDQSFNYELRVLHNNTLLLYYKGEIIKKIGIMTEKE
jgi:hypothetical protein